MNNRNSPVRKWSKEIVIEEIKNLDFFSAKQIQKKRADLYGAAVRIFGSWKNAVEAAGFDYSLIRKNKLSGFWTEMNVVEGIKLLNQKHSGFARKNKPALYGAALRLFGSWGVAVRMAGFDYDKVAKVWPSKRKKLSD
ncbi:MAG: hypothetical protein A4S09_06375 [Proteobacteria bacterium SG_bin7]|nr:MAG: hypothetical protein A4S09_06375 [Proteobacteria bacterium SG_bin7]